MPLNSKGLITRVYILLEQAATLWYKEEAEKEAARKAEIATYKARISKPAEHALPTSLAVKKAALAAIYARHKALRAAINCFLELRSNLAIKAKD
ncbi:hypothetical protein P8C59_005461 [Phyllachora maydis]|uniref:Uncharacterized protein n=1 Tax=Phyllachora maydis TaxID=1825666 RepID=A0AAD9I5G8_9PEZI|nr:hypothetical protein P8C59_005461 [Phyllachora maydis]